MFISVYSTRPANLARTREAQRCDYMNLLRTKTTKKSKIKVVGSGVCGLGLFAVRSRESWVNWVRAKMLWLLFVDTVYMTVKRENHLSRWYKSITGKNVSPDSTTHVFRFLKTGWFEQKRTTHFATTHVDAAADTRYVTGLTLFV